MAKFVVEVKKELTYTYEIEADDEEEAESLVLALPESTWDAEPEALEIYVAEVYPTESDID
jgi:hypothetical protein